MKIMEVTVTYSISTSTSMLKRER